MSKMGVMTGTLNRIPAPLVVRCHPRIPSPETAAGTHPAFPGPVILSIQPIQ
jgi:hypothetical protein